VEVLDIIGMLMMMPVVSGPPQWSPLGSAGAKNGENELGRAAGLEGLVCKVTMVESSDREHAHQEECDRKTDGEGANAGIERQQTRQVKRYERNNP
jgi:hypothetical protein